MKTRRQFSRQDAAEIFEGAAAQRALAVVTVQDEGDWRSFKARFLEIDPQRRFFVLEHEPHEGEPMPALTPGQYTGVSFRHRSRKILFATVVEAKGKYVFSDSTTVNAIRYRWPESLMELQRRAYQRTPVPSSANLLANVWVGGAAARPKVQSGALDVVTGTMLDISCGGALIRTNLTAPPAWSTDLTVGVEMQMPDGRTPMIIDGRYRGARPDETGKLCVALQFIGLELTLDGRMLLQRLSRNVQHLNRNVRPNSAAGEKSDVNGMSHNASDDT